MTIDAANNYSVNYWLARICLVVTRKNGCVNSCFPVIHTNFASSRDFLIAPQQVLVVDESTSPTNGGWALFRMSSYVQEKEKHNRTQS
jgi:hypothetical protein